MFSTADNLNVFDLNQSCFMIPNKLGLILLTKTRTIKTKLI